MRWMLLSLCLLWGMSACRSSKDSPPHTSSMPGSKTPTQEISTFELTDVRRGSKSMVVRADNAFLYEAQKTATLVRPRVTFFKESSGTVPSSTLVAPEGRVDTENHVIEAWGGVVIQTADKSLLKTERLRYDPATHKIVSHVAVVLSRPGSITRGQGFESDPELTRVRILNQRAVMDSTR